MIGRGTLKKSEVTPTEESLPDPADFIAAFNLQSLSSGGLLRENQTEIKLFNSVYSQNQYFDANGDRQDNLSRATYFTSLGQFLYGLTPQLNVGFDFNIRSVRNDIANSSPWSVLRFEDIPTVRTQLTTIAPKVRFAPFKKNKDFTIQSTLYFPVQYSLEGYEENGYVFLDFDKNFWFNQFMYTKMLGDHFQLFLEGDLNYYFNNGVIGNPGLFSIATKGFLSYFPNDKITFYAMSDYTPTLYGPWGTNYFSQSGLGGKFLITDFLEIEVLYARFMHGKNSGAGQSFNLGIRFIK